MRSLNLSDDDKNELQSYAMQREDCMAEEWMTNINDSTEAKLTLTRTATGLTRTIEALREATSPPSTTIATNAMTIKTLSRWI